MKFCEQLGKYIEQLSCTAKELCELSGISPSTFSRYRSGERIPEIDTVAFDGLCNALEAVAREKGYGDISHTRMRRYEILLEFLENVPEISMDQVKDQMIYDLYLRENLKSRPGFARDQKPFERQIWDFRKREKVAKNAHVEVFADGTVLLFNYADRDPLTNNAHVTDVTKDVFENLNRD